MKGENRVVSTTALREHNATTSGSLAVSSRILDRLDPDAMHVIVTTGRTNGNGYVICDALLDIGHDRPARVPVFVEGELLQALPTAFSVISCASRLVPTILDTVNSVPAYESGEDVARELWEELLAHDAPDGVELDGLDGDDE